ncbi:MAG: tetratricopeptide repeat protein [Planctomycetaceae bacterium]|nr:tetratricopeptide repeat protein [Planctomycetaceae bacterium]
MVIFIVLWLRFICSGVIAMSGDGVVLGQVAKDIRGNSTDIGKSNQLQYYQRQYANTPVTQKTDGKATQQMGGYPSNFANNVNVNVSNVVKAPSVYNNGSSNNNGNNIGNNNNNNIGAYIAAGYGSRNVLPINPVIMGGDSAASLIGSSNSNGNGNGNSNIDSLAGKRQVSNQVNNNINVLDKNLSVVVSPDIPKSNISNSSIPKTGVGLVAAATGNNSGDKDKNKDVDTDKDKGGGIEKVGGENLLGDVVLDSGVVSDVSSGGVSGGSDVRMKPVESMQEVIMKPGKLRSLLPSFLLRKKVDDPFIEDDGLEAVEKACSSKLVTGLAYIESATKSKTVVSRDIFLRAMREELAGNYGVAVDLYKEFIRLNSRRTADGTLAVPYHRLALIVWNRERVMGGAEVYFKYALKYAKDGIIQVVVNDYTKFLTECGKLDQAEAILRNTISLFPYDGDLRVELGRCLARQDRAVEALRHIKPILGESAAYVELAAIYRGRGDYAMSEVLMRRRDDYIAKSNRNNGGNGDNGDNGNIANVDMRRVASVAANFRNDNSRRGVGGNSNNAIYSNRSNNSNSSGTDNFNNWGYSRDVVGVRGVSFPTVARDASSAGNNSRDNNNINVNANTNILANASNRSGNIRANNVVGNNVGAPVDPFNVVANGNMGGNINGVNYSMDPSNKNIGNKSASNQQQSQLQNETTNSPSYRIKGYHYSVEDVPPVFLQY